MSEASPKKRKKSPPRVGHVKRTVRLTPNMHRVTFTGDDLTGFPEDQNGANCKLLFPAGVENEADLRAALSSGDRPPMRTYTVRSYRAASNELDIDFVVHGDDGLAGPWAAQCKEGDVLAIVGPGPKKLNHLDAEYFIFCADLSALPAAAAALEDLPSDAQGVAFFEITTPDDEYPLNAPPGIDVNWLVHADPHKVSLAQRDALRACDWPTDDVSIFVAGEHNAMLALRDHILKERAVPRSATYISGYWKIGLVEDQHQVEKRKDAV